MGDRAAPMHACLHARSTRVLTLIKLVVLRRHLHQPRVELPAVLAFRLLCSYLAHAPLSERPAMLLPSASPVCHSVAACCAQVHPLRLLQVPLAEPGARPQHQPALRARL